MVVLLLEFGEIGVNGHRFDWFKDLEKVGSTTVQILDILVGIRRQSWPAMSGGVSALTGKVARVGESEREGKVARQLFFFLTFRRTLPQTRM